MAERRLSALIRTLHEAGVEFLVVGGLSAVLNGAPVNTFDVDVVHRRTIENVDRILPALDSIEACYRIQPERRLRPAKTALLSPGHQNLITKFGPLDLLGSLGENLGYEQLLAHCTAMQIADDMQVPVLDLEMLIQIKEQLNGEKDRAMLPLLRRTLEEKNRLSGS